ncbi:MAG TPA: hypothetical protein VFM34_05080 [Moraxellaceae bacterium]|nr:hypothetical protein [Moraxellaceae bacterium]
MKATRTSIADFLQTTKSNGARLVRVAVKANDPILRTKGIDVQQIRKVKDAAAEYWDELGNRIMLTTDNRVIQL